MNKHLNEYAALLKKKKTFCVEQLKTLDKFLLLCRRMQIRCEGLLQADAFRQLSTGEADDAVRLPEEEEFSLGLLQISATLLKDRITGTEASLRAVQVGANHFCEKIDTAYGHDWAAWTDAVWNAAHRAEVIMVTSIFSSRRQRHDAGEGIPLSRHYRCGRHDKKLVRHRKLLHLLTAA